MRVVTSEERLDTRGHTDILDITARVQAAVSKAGIAEGLAVAFVPGSTASITTIEDESGLHADLRAALERLAPEGAVYQHDRRWGDGNGYAHVRAALLGPSVAVPVQGGRLMLGTWQQIVLVDFDNRPRTRRVVIQIIGE
ncbi:MAG: secondary thiamine-phosphate synthase enzyme YjbQ [Anaerolineae bacterium]|nr:secondary thiamine-phosphate synthase enzyme YjbQ [Anaerolineae bacterium]